MICQQIPPDLIRRIRCTHMPVPRLSQWDTQSDNNQCIYTKRSSAVISMLSTVISGTLERILKSKMNRISHVILAPMLSFLGPDIEPRRRITSVTTEGIYNRVTYIYGRLRTPLSGYYFQANSGHRFNDEHAASPI